MKHPNGNWRIKATGSDDMPAHHFANTIPDNATRKAHTSPRATTRHSSHGTSTEGRAC